MNVLEQIGKSGEGSAASKPQNNLAKYRVCEKEERIGLFLDGQNSIS